MMIPDHQAFSTYPEASRIWIFQSVEPVPAPSATRILSEVRSFLKEWKAHQVPVTAAAEFYGDHVLVIAVHAQGEQASGCATDAMVQAVQRIAGELQVDLFDRLHIPVWEKDQWTFLRKKDLFHALSEDRFTPETKILDQSIGTVGDLRERWVVPIRNSWVSRHPASGIPV